MRSESSIPTRSLIFGMAADDGSLSAGALFDLADDCGLTGEAMRLCLRRLVAEGVLRHRGGRGREASFELAPGAASEVLPEAPLLDFALRQDAGLEPWDRMWRLVAFSIPEARRPERDELRRRLTFLGGGQLHGGLYVSPNRWDALVREAAKDLGVADELTIACAETLTVGGVREPRALAGRLWPLREIESGYRRFNRAAERHLASVGRGDLAPRETVRRVFVLVAAFSRAITPDPLLPAELLPERWAGREARAALLRAFAALRALSASDEVPHGLGRLADRFLSIRQTEVEVG